MAGRAALLRAARKEADRLRLEIVRQHGLRKSPPVEGAISELRSELGQLEEGIKALWRASF